MANNLELGQNIELIFDGKSYKSKIENIIDDQTYVVGVPIIHHSYVFIPLNESVKLRYIAKDCIYQFDGKVVKKSVDPVYTITIAQIGPFERIQRRENFRLEVSIKANFKIKDDETMYEGIIKDISGGGVKLATNKRLNINDEVLIEFTLPGSVNFSLNGVVTRNVKNGANFDVGISFKDIDTNSREKIVSFIFAEQRKLLKRGLME
ncbi:flagellar brake protein [Calorimonas adulescens]|uniref:Flagellar brake protein n=1 Tax=Calorimonas adulescens TaxID=2606906 RepID=A0A5D8QGP5_9THEO|nr:PilZ domain-containing protein [Calorimonas adulescens]TZE83334.1 hypothetical protein FWJ32_00150 [Calorimonas adulescens]